MPNYNMELSILRLVGVEVVNSMVFINLVCYGCIVKTLHLNFFIVAIVAVIQSLSQLTEFHYVVSSYCKQIYLYIKTRMMWFLYNFDLMVCSMYRSF